MPHPTTTASTLTTANTLPTTTEHSASILPVSNPSSQSAGAKGLPRVVAAAPAHQARLAGRSPTASTDPLHSHSPPPASLSSSPSSHQSSSSSPSGEPRSTTVRLLHSRFPSFSRIRSGRSSGRAAGKTGNSPLTSNKTSIDAQARSTLNKSQSTAPSVSPPAAASALTLSLDPSTDTTVSEQTADSDRILVQSQDESRESLLNTSAPNVLSSSYSPPSVRSADSTTSVPQVASTKPLQDRVDSGSTDTTGRSSNTWPGATDAQAQKMHQTSSRLLRMTDDDRPFTRDKEKPVNKTANMRVQDFKDLFSTLMVSLPLTPHRVRFSKIEHTFTSDEAITNLGSLKFSQSNRMPDPKDPSRIVTTTTTTTFSMAKEMARSVCAKFLEARFIESCENKTDFSSKSAVWQLTPKGMRVLTRFCNRNGIHQRHVNELLDSSRNMMQLVILERESETDKLNHDRAMIEVIFRRFAGESGPNVKAASSASDAESLNEYATGLVGVRMIKSRKQFEKDNPYIFNGKAAIDWLMDCCMVVDKRECYELANLFMQNELIAPVLEERNTATTRFQPVKSAHYHVTERGMKIVGWVRSPNGSVNGEATTKLPPGVARDSNTNRMTIIIRDPALRLLFREFLQETHCEENLTFYLEVKGFLVDYGVAKRSSPQRLDLIRETLASAYSLYNAFLAPGSPCELNIDHNLRNALAGRMTRAVGEDSEMLSSLDEVAVLFDQAQTSVFKLMASDSVPKFSRDPKYANVLRDRNLEHLLNSFSATSIS